jgi:site-specific DNA-methyltransferase (adenine-specific)
VTPYYQDGQSRPCILAGCPHGGVVLDCFAGSGTTLQVAKESQCGAIGIELNPEYCGLITDRLQQAVFNFASEVA